MARISQLSLVDAVAQKPYLEAWLKRTRRQLAQSGRLSEIAWILSREGGEVQDEWRTRLRGLLEGDEHPSLDLLVKIDSLLAGSKSRIEPVENQSSLF